MLAWEAGVDQSGGTSSLHLVCRSALFFASLVTEMSGNYYYHYSTPENVLSMVQSGQIKPSTNTTTDALLGQGVYFTTKPPQTSDAKLCQNNYNHDRDRGYDERLEAYIRIPQEQLPDTTCLRQGRNVCVNPGSVDLNEVDFKVGTRARFGR